MRSHTKSNITVVFLAVTLLVANTTQAQQTITTSPGSTLGTVYRVGNGVTAPKIVGAPDPFFPEEARKSHVMRATVVLRAVVGMDGKTHQIRVVRSAGSGFDEAALDAVQLWRFKPGEKDGQPVAVEISVEVNFSL